MNCETAHTFLDAYSTDELDLVSAMEVETHLADCSNCARELASIRSLRQMVKGPSLRYTAPTALRQTLAAAEESRSSFGGWRVARIAAVVALLLLPWVAWYLSASRSNATQFAEAITAAHVRSLQGDHLLDVVSTDQHTVKPWFAGKIDFSPAVTDFASEGFPLIGGRLDYLDHRTVAAVVYRRNKHLINVFTWPTNESDEPPRASQLEGFNLITWTRGGLRYSAVSDLNSQELSQFVELVRGGGAKATETTHKS
jgi:anti-sigma factor RsiW